MPRIVSAESMELSKVSSSKTRQVESVTIGVAVVSPQAARISGTPSSQSLLNPFVLNREHLEGIALLSLSFDSAMLKEVCEPHSDPQNPRDCKEPAHCLADLIPTAPPAIESDYGAKTAGDPDDPFKQC